MAKKNKKFVCEIIGGRDDGAIVPITFYKTDKEMYASLRKSKKPIVDAKDSLKLKINKRGK